MWRITSFVPTTTSLRLATVFQSLSPCQTQVFLAQRSSRLSMIWSVALILVLSPTLLISIRRLSRSGGDGCGCTAQLLAVPNWNRPTTNSWRCSRGLVSAIHRGQSRRILDGNANSHVWRTFSSGGSKDHIETLSRKKVNRKVIQRKTRERSNQLHTKWLTKLAE